MGFPRSVFDAGAATAGATMYWTIALHGTYFRPSTSTVMLMVVGAFAFAVVAIALAMSRTSGHSHRNSMGREVIDSQGKFD